MKQVLKQLSACYLLMYLILSCTEKKSSEVITVAVDYNQLSELSLSDISEDVKPIRLELTDKSMISKVKRVLYDKKNIIIVEKNEIIIFDNSGKFIRQIGSIGQGPGEFVGICDVTADFRNKKIYVYSYNMKIICYDFNGNMIKEKKLNNFSNGIVNYLNYTDKGLALLFESVIKRDDGRFNSTYLYYINNDLSICDSLKVREIKHNGIGVNSYFNDYVVNDSMNTYLYYPDIMPNSFLLDTLCQIEDNKLIPAFNLKFKDDGILYGEKKIYILNIYKSFRYVFAFYDYNSECYNFCYDTQNKNTYNIKGGYLDDFYTKEKVLIRPLNNNSNMYYFLYTNMSDDDKDEPNPTLYIGTLKK